MQILAQGIKELSAEYSRLLDDEVFKFLEKNGYKVDKNPRAIKQLQEQLKSEGKVITIRTENQKMSQTVDGLIYTFDLKIEFRGG